MSKKKLYYLIAIALAMLICFFYLKSLLKNDEAIVNTSMKTTFLNKRVVIDTVNPIAISQFTKSYRLLAGNGLLAVATEDTLFWYTTALGRLPEIKTKLLGLYDIGFIDSVSFNYISDKQLAYIKTSNDNSVTNILQTKSTDAIYIYGKNTVYGTLSKYEDGIFKSFLIDRIDSSIKYDYTNQIKQFVDADCYDCILNYGNAFGIELHDKKILLHPYSLNILLLIDLQSQKDTIIKLIDFPYKPRLVQREVDFPGGGKVYTCSPETGGENTSFGSLILKNTFYNLTATVVKSKTSDALYQYIDLYSIESFKYQKSIAVMISPEQKFIKGFSVDNTSLYCLFSNDQLGYVNTF